MAYLLPSSQFNVLFFAFQNLQFWDILNFNFLILIKPNSTLLQCVFNKTWDFEENEHFNNVGIVFIIW